MSTRLIHRPARTTRPPAAPAPRTIEAPPNLPEGKAGNIAMSLLPVAGVMSSVVMMTVVRNSQFAALGAIILVVTVIGSVALLFSQRGKAQRTRRTQREAYLAYVEDLREELSGEERERRERADVLNPRRTPCTTSCGTLRASGSGAGSMTTSCACGSAPARCPYGIWGSPSRVRRCSHHPTCSCSTRRRRW